MSRHQRTNALTYPIVAAFYIVLILISLAVSVPGGQFISAAFIDSLNYSVKTNPKDGAQMVFIPAGEFIMGSDAADIERIWKALNWDVTEKSYTRSEQPFH